MSCWNHSARAATLVLALAPALAQAHAVCGSRFFPATLGVDDPGVGDEVALPTLSYLPGNEDGVNQADVSFNYTKTIAPGFGLSVGEGATFLNGTGWGRQDLSLGAHYNFFCVPEAEFMGTASLDVDVGKTYTNGMGADFTTLSPALNVGLGFGGLPKSLNLLRPFALTAELGEDLPTQSWTNGAQNPRAFNWGFAIQYSLPYFNANVAEIDNGFLKRLIPITEFTFSRPVGNYDPATFGPARTTGSIQPGVIYAAGSWQLAVEAVLPINSASGRGVGVVGELHLYLDDILPDTLGRPIFGGRK